MRETGENSPLNLDNDKVRVIAINAKRIDDGCVRRKYLVPSKAIDNAAPNAAPDEMPSMYGLTSGFLSIVCSAAPEIPIQAPKSIASIALGSLMLKIIACSIESSSRTDGIAFSGNGYFPTDRYRRNSNRGKRISPNMYPRVFDLLQF